VLSTGKYSAFREFVMKFAELYEVSDRYMAELDRVTEYGGIRDALALLAARNLPRGSVYKDPLIAAWFKKHASDIADYAVREIREAEPLGISYESNVISNAGIELPDRTLTWYIQNMMPELVPKIERIAEYDPAGAARAMTGLKQLHGIDIKRYVNPETVVRIITDSIIRKDVGPGISALRHVLSVDTALPIAYLNKHKTAVIKSLLANMREGDQWEYEIVNDVVNNLQAMGADWPEFKIIKDSIKASKK